MNLMLKRTACLKAIFANLRSISWKNNRYKHTFISDKKVNSKCAFSASYGLISDKITLHRRVFCTFSKNVDRNHVTENPRPDLSTLLESITKINSEREDNVAKQFPRPKNALHNIYDIVSQEFQNLALKVSPEYKPLRKGTNYMEWTCTYHIKWPEDKVFSQTGSTKQDASHKAALSVLQHLKFLKKINKDGLPVLYDAQELSSIKYKRPVLTLKPNVERKLREIGTKYETYLSPYFNQQLESSKMPIDTLGEVNAYSEDLKIPRKQHFEGLEVYKAKESTKLPISDYKDEFVKLLENNNVVIIKGEPGCGKSTRIPQYILEAWAKDNDLYGDHCRIVISQPRRIAAISLAARVANERNEDVGQIVGYQVRFNSSMSNRTRIMYCTTGILLRHLQTDPKLLNYTHVILDEAHERDVNTDLLLNLLRNALRLNPYLKLIIMSATIDTKAFQQYFIDSPTLNIPGFTYPVKINFLEDIQNFVQVKKSFEMCDSGEPCVVHDDVINTIKYIHKTKEEGAILCFLPGWEDIIKIKKSLPERRDWYVLCLHSRLQDSEQRKIFSRAPPGVRKIILATNIAETSVTVDDVVYVIDTGIHKEERFDADKGIAAIDNHWISESSMTQRKGRAGRVQPGESFHLYSKKKYQTFAKYSIPEILRTSLTKIVLDSKVFSNNMNALEFFSELPCPPDENAVLKAVNELEELELLDEKECLTPLGRVLADFQLEPRLSRALVNSIVFKCVTPVVDIVTLFSADTGIFSTGLVDKEGVRQIKGSFSKTSDHDALMKLFENWLRHFEDEDEHGVQEICYRYNLVPHKMRTMQKLRNLHFEYLYKGFQRAGPIPLSDDNSDSGEIVKGALLSGVGTVLQHRGWDIVKGRMKLNDVFVTRTNHKATVTPDSINFKKCVSYKNMFLLYINETRSNVRRTTLIRECSLVPPLLVLLFKSNELEIEEIDREHYSDDLESEDQVVLKLVGTQIRFLCDRRQALEIQTCKSALTNGLRYFIYQMTVGKQYDSKLNEEWGSVLSILSDALKSASVR